MIKIAVIGTRGLPARYSGIEASVEAMARRLDPLQYQLVVYCRRSVQESPGDELPRAVRRRYTPTINTKNFGAFFHALISTVHAMCGDVDIVHFHALGPAMFAFLPRLTGKISIVTIHALDWKRKKWGRMARAVLKWCEYPAVFFPHRTIVVAKAMQQYFEQKYHRPLTYIPNGVELPARECPDDPRDLYGRYILFVGRLVPEKGIQYLIQAFNELAPEVKLLIAGEPSFTAEYADGLKRMAGPKVVFLGFMQGTALRSLYAHAELFVLPSEVEGLSVSVLEAMSYGRCVLVSDVPECREVIGDAGVTFKSKDAADLREKLRFLLQNPDTARQIGLRGRQRVEREYNWDTIMKTVEDTYQSALRESKGARCAR